MRKFELTFARHGIEHRAPYCDPALVQTAFGIADGLKLKHGRNKYILRKALATIVDPIFLKVPKRPQRMRYDLAFAQRVDQLAGELLASDEVRRRGLFEPGSIECLFSRGPNRPYTPEAAMRIWTAMLTELWVQLFVDRRGAFPQASEKAA